MKKISRVKKDTSVKVTTLLLHDGYAETSTWGAVPMYCARGFDSLQEALTDLNQLARKYIDAEFEQNNKLKYMPKLTKKETVAEYVRNMIRGDFQTSDAWECFVERGTWDMTQGYLGFDWKNRIQIANAPELIASAPYWLERDSAKWPTDDPEVAYQQQSDEEFNWGLNVLASYCDFANDKMRRKMFLGSYIPKENE